MTGFACIYLALHVSIIYLHYIQVILNLNKLNTLKCHEILLCMHKNSYLAIILQPNINYTITARSIGLDYAYKTQYFVKIHGKDLTTLFALLTTSSITPHFNRCVFLRLWCICCSCLFSLQNKLCDCVKYLYNTNMALYQFRKCHE